MDHETRLPDVETNVPLDIELVDRYLAGQATVDERAFVEQGLQHPRHASVLRALRAIVPGNEGPGTQQDDDIERIVMRLEKRRLARAAVLAQSGATLIKHRLRAFRFQTPQTDHSKHVIEAGAKSRRQILRRRILVGAITSMGAAALSWVLVSAGHQFSVDVTRGAHTYVTKAGQRATLRLADGSRVILAPRTTVVVPADFGPTTRLLTLTGEAYFSVAAGNYAPFSVRTGNTRADVLGTAFAVRRYANDSYTQVAVTAGRVSVAAVPGSGTAGRRPMVVLSAGMVGRVTDSTATATAVTNMEEQVGWVDGRLVFHNTPVPRALETIEQWYGYRFRLADRGLAGGKLTVTLDSANATDMLLTLKTLLDVTMTFDGPFVTLHPRRTTGGRVRRDTRDSLSHAFPTEVGR